MTKDIHIRSAKASDSVQILDMLTCLANETGENDRFSCTTEKITEYGFGDKALFQCLIATHLNNDVGMALFFPTFSTTRGAPGSYLQDLYIYPDYRDLGLGLRLLREVVTFSSKQWNACYLDLMVHGHNEGADRFYRRYGFIERDHDRHLSLDSQAYKNLSSV